MRCDDVVAVILGGGRGARLYPLTAQRAKPAVPLGTKYRLIDIPISNCINSGVSKIYVLTQFLSVSLHAHIYQAYKFDIFSKGFVTLLPAEQTLTSDSWYQGTADAVRKQMHRFVQWRPRDIIILSGDHLYNMDYSRFIEFHRQRDADVTIAVQPVSARDAGRFGILKTEPDGAITRFREKPKEKEELLGLESNPGSEKPYLGSMGIYVFKSEVLSDFMDGPGEDFGNNIIPSAMESHSVYGYEFRGYWEDIGTISAFYKANLDMVGLDTKFDLIDPKNPIYTRSRFLPPTRMGQCRVRATAMAEGCTIGDVELEECVIGLRSLIRSGTRMCRVIMMGADHLEEEEIAFGQPFEGMPRLGIGRDCRIEGAIIDKNARIGNGVIIASHEGRPDADNELFCVRDGIVVIPKNTVIPHGTVIGQSG